MSHLAVTFSEEESLTARPDSYTFARALPGWLKGLRALIGGVSEMRAVACEQRGDLTSRFIKVSQFRISGLPDRVFGPVI